MKFFRNWVAFAVMAIAFFFMWLYNGLVDLHRRLGYAQAGYNMLYGNGAHISGPVQHRRPPPRSSGRIRMGTMVNGKLVRRRSIDAARQNDAGSIIMAGAAA